MSGFVIGSENLERKIGGNFQGDAFAGTKDEMSICQHKEFYENSFYHDEFRRKIHTSGEVENFLSSQIQVFNNELLNTSKVSTSQGELCLQRKDDGAATERKEHHITPMSFIIARDVFQLDRDRQRKETHNKIEKKRRSFINAKIAELGKMLPDHIDRTQCNRKGTILKETVDYIKKLKTDQELLKLLESKIRYLDFEFRRMVERLEFLEKRPVINLTNCNAVGMAGKLTQTNASSGNYQTNSQNQDQLFCTSAWNGFRSDMTISSTQPDKLDAEWNGLSFLEKDNDPVYFESPTFADTLSNYF